MPALSFLQAGCLPAAQQHQSTEGSKVVFTFQNVIIAMMIVTNFTAAVASRAFVSYW